MDRLPALLDQSLHTSFIGHFIDFPEIAIDSASHGLGGLLDGLEDEVDLRFRKMVPGEIIPDLMLLQVSPKQ
jgi:hypothetical protein